uniref:Ig-like domain-containing protein n=1 Tax=Paramormyrops kingsleyae TaxID=1676925 RepID=A0A3B3S0Y8_9TELE
DGTEITRPTVKVLDPSQNEICTKKKTVTLVCVATEFYPDHIQVYWQKNGANITHGYQTDERATRNENTGKYSITSRLRIPLKKWYNTRNRFTCLTRYINETSYNKTSYIDSFYTINGVKDDIISRSQWAKLTYGTLIAKSAVYGMFIFVVVWKLKVCLFFIFS